MQPSGVFTYSDTGVPEGLTEDYVTLVVVHGFAYHAGMLAFHYLRSAPYS